jgi:hypothetical protein
MIKKERQALDIMRKGGSKGMFGFGFGIGVQSSGSKFGFKFGFEIGVQSSGSKFGFGGNDRAIQN